MAPEEREREHGISSNAGSEYSVAAGLNLASVRLFDGLSGGEKKWILGEARNVTFPENAQLCKEGHKACRLFLVTKGNAKFSRLTRDGKEVLLFWFGPGDTFGLGSLLADPPPFFGSAEAVSVCEVLTWSHDTMRRFAHQFPQLSCNALGIALVYLSTLVERHSEVLGNAAKGRIARVLFNLAQRSGNVNSDGIDIQITNDQLASLSDVSSFTASRVLSEWQRKGTLTKRRKGLRLHAPEALVPE